MISGKNYVICSQVNLPVREEKSRGVYVAGATEEYVTSAEEVIGAITFSF